jgi:hypothetical protein
MTRHLCDQIFGSGRICCMRLSLAGLSVKRKSEARMQQVLKSLHVSARTLIRSYTSAHSYCQTHTTHLRSSAVTSYLSGNHVPIMYAWPHWRYQMKGYAIEVLCRDMDHHLISKNSLRYGGRRNKDLHDSPNHHLSLRAMTAQSGLAPTTRTISCACDVKRSIGSRLCKQT